MQSRGGIVEGFTAMDSCAGEARPPGADGARDRIAADVLILLELSSCGDGCA